ncbi:YDG/SRA domain-containing protein [Dactylosporangium matsuzakiense]|uniref:YDG domain-containing protein n=1 Tax=Dactylosporangium matsuzakiense TaxID=53360 RepID=A0A9W6KVH1_9ACTN|nr:YDG/SRA domain-containing protein [Dactylosporangium matsuzakiense]UWZ42862.1 HNH endonuclease [Dactylosporangium matsuzakiense]GLL07326.1 hypothetical protein GCM10017581_090780 [Dactylosporangium matsuzakiense]
MAQRTYGEIPGYPVGSTFENREMLHDAGVHRPLQAGICGGQDGAESIVVSGGYPDDEDYGVEIVYTGHGGKDPNSKRQIAHQELTVGNAGLARSQFDGNPVRVVRGAGGEKAYSPATGLRYDGLYRVVDHWHTIGRDGFRIWRFRLVTIESPDEPAPPPTQDAAEVGPVGRIPTVIQRLVRSTAVANSVKRMHDYRCQVCGIQLETPAGFYAEAAHIRALGRPHLGPDVPSNVLCLCPNHHVLFDAGAIYIDVSGSVRDTETHEELSKLIVTARHTINPAQLEYHRDIHA